MLKYFFSLRLRPRVMWNLFDWLWPLLVIPIFFVPREELAVYGIELCITFLCIVLMSICVKHIIWDEPPEK